MTAQAETDEAFRARILRVAEDRDVRDVRAAQKRDLDVLGKKYGRFRYGVPLEGAKKPGSE